MRTIIGPRMQFIWKGTAETSFHELTGSIRMQKQYATNSRPLQLVHYLPHSCASMPLTRHIVKEVYYPKYSETRKFYDQCRNANKGYGGLLSVTFRTTKQAVTFFDELETAKGPSLGTNFTLR